MTFDLGINLPLNHIWDIIASSVLTPVDIDLSWPPHNFVIYGGGSSVDVLGLFSTSLMITSSAIVIRITNSS